MCVRVVCVSVRVRACRRRQMMQREGFLCKLRNNVSLCFPAVVRNVPVVGLPR